MGPCRLHDIERKALQNSQPDASTCIVIMSKYAVICRHAGNDHPVATALRACWCTITHIVASRRFCNHLQSPQQS